ncbi:MAG: rod shape-determining protein RodA [Acidobacteria bacterium]|nr:rod shape-determining protein RodA [Acidobacteriota bacterium]MYG74273.1 rod shape-determining protein RodA [Acidobacteriota bacterium]
MHPRPGPPGAEGRTSEPFLSREVRTMELRAREGVDRVLLVCVGLLVAIAVLLLESALRGVASGATLGAHLIRLGIALGVGVVAYRMDHRQLARLSPALFLVALGLSAVAITSGALRAGTRRWLEVGALTVQPGELAKISLVLLLAHLIARSRHEPLSRRATVGWIAASGALVLAVAAQPDLGSAAILFGIGVGMVFFSGVTISRKWMLAASGSAVLALPLIWVFGLRDYQRIRVLSFLNPESDPLGAGYQTLQASIAVGSGGLFGTGWLQGPQTSLQFLPAPHTDFVFAVLAEEFGFLGVVAVLGLYLVLGLRLLQIAVEAVENKDPTGAFMVGGFFLMIHLQALYNIAMVAGIVPIKGFPLPFMSYGGNSLLIAAAAIGLAASVRRRNFLT